MMLDPLMRSLPPRGRVMRWVSTAIGSGHLRIGQPLPSERVLAEQLGVSRTAVRAALDEMAADGAIDRPNGGRLRRVARAPVQSAAVGASMVMDDTLAILSSTMVSPGPVVSGYQEAYIKHQAAVCIEDSGLHVMVVNPGKLLERGIQHFLGHPPAGLLVVDEVAENSPAHQVLAACSGTIPTVIHGRVPDLERYDRVITDHYAGGRMLTRWLIERGCRRVQRVWLSDEVHDWLTRRSEGCAETVREAGLPVLPEIRVPAADRLANTILSAPPKTQRKIWDDQVRRIAGYLIERFGGATNPDERPDAIVCMTDGHAVQVSAALRVFGLTPNKDVLVTGYDNNWHMVPYLRFESARPAATVEKHNDRCARDMVALLRERIAGELPPEPQCRSVEHELRPLI